MPGTKPRDNDDERFARIEMMMEEYRVKHEDLELTWTRSAPAPPPAGTVRDA